MTKSAYIIVITFIFCLKLTAQKSEYTYLCYAYDTTSDAFGYIDSKGEFAIKPQYLLAFNFSDDRAFVQFKDSTWGLINYKGEKIYALPDTIGKHVFSYLRSLAGNIEKQSYMNEHFWVFAYDFFDNIEIRDSVLLLNEEWFEFTFQKRKISTFSSAQIYPINYYFHLKRGLLKGSNNKLITGYPIYKFSNGLAIFRNAIERYEFIDATGQTKVLIPDSLSKGGYFIKQVFCNGSATLYTRSSYIYTNANGQKTDCYFSDKLKYVSTIYSDGKIVVVSDSNEVKKLFLDSQNAELVEKRSKENKIVYYNEQVYYKINGCLSAPKDYCNCGFFEKNDLFAYTSNVIEYPKSNHYYSKEEKDKAHNGFIGFWDKNQKVKIKPKYKYNTVGTEFRKVYKK